MKLKLTVLLTIAAALGQATAAVPVINSVKNTSFIVGLPCSFTFTATNPPLTPASWYVSGTLPGSVSFDTTTGKLTGTPVAGEEGTYALSVSVDNASGTSDFQTFTLKVGDVFAIIKYNTAATWTTYQADRLQETKPYTHKPVSGSESWSRYDVVNLSTGMFRSIYYYTIYDRGKAVKRYYFDPTEQAGYSGAAIYLFSRAGGTTALPTYRMFDEFAFFFTDGGPDGSSPSTFLNRSESMYYVSTGAFGMTTVLAATTVPLIPAFKTLLPTGATGIDNFYNFQASYPSDTPGTLPDSIYVEFNTGAPTVNYDSVLSASANKAAPAAASLIDYDGTVLRPRSSEYAVKVVRDSLEILGYEQEYFGN